MKKLIIVGILSVLLIGEICSVLAFNNQTLYNISQNSIYNNSNIHNNNTGNMNGMNTNYANMNYTESLYLIVKNSTAYVTDILNGSNNINVHHVRSAGIVLYENIYHYNYSHIRFKNSSNVIIFYYNFSVDNINNTINITIPQLEDYVGVIGGSIGIRVPPKHVKIMILVYDKLIKTNGNYLLEYNASSKKITSVAYVNNISSICNVYHTNYINRSNFYGYAVSNITSIKENGSYYIIKNTMGTFPFRKNYNIYIYNNTAYLKEPQLYVKIYNSAPNNVVILNSKDTISHSDINNSNSEIIYKYAILFAAIIIGFGLIALAIYLKRGK